MSGFNHYTVMRKEAVDGLNVRTDGIYVDCTLGGAGHSEYLLSKLDYSGHLYAFDRDEQAIKNARLRLKRFIENEQVTLVKSNFCDIKEKLKIYGVAKVDGIFYDLGVSSPQLDEASRGFSYHQDALLDMRMDLDNEKSAYDVVNFYSYADLIKIFYRYGEEKFSKRIARIIEQERKMKPIATTNELVELIKKGIPAAARRAGGHPAKRIFQAIRIEVNDELGSLENSLHKAIDLLKVGGRISVIAFHSLEDRSVKTILKRYSTLQDLPYGLPIIPEEFRPILKLVNRKPVLPSIQELAENNRSRSAKLRIAEKVKEEF